MRTCTTPSNWPLRFLLLSGLAIAGVAAFAVDAPSADAKGGPDWILTAGALGEYAMKFHPETDAESQLSDLRGTLVAAPVDPGPAYDIHVDGWLSPEYYARVARYYPEAGLLYGHTWDDPIDGWMQPDATTIAMLDRAITTAKAHMAAGELERGVVAATFRSRGMDVASYTFTGNRPWDEDTSTPLFVFTGSNGSPEFAMGHLASVIELNRAGKTTEQPDYRINVTGSIPGGMWGGSLGHYRLARDGQPGWFVPHAWNLNEPNIYYETTPGFDAFIQAAIDDELARRAEAAEQQQATPVPTGNSVGAVHWLGTDSATASESPGRSLARTGFFAAVGLVGVVAAAYATVASRRR